MDMNEFLIEAHKILDEATVNDGLGFESDAIKELVSLRKFLDRQPELEYHVAYESSKPKNQRNDVVTNGWDTIKEVRLDLPAATLLAKEGKKAAARDRMKHARDMLVTYCEDERHPEHGFECEEIGS